MVESTTSSCMWMYTQATIMLHFICSKVLSIFLQPNQVQRDEPVVISKYLENPLCVDGESLANLAVLSLTSWHLFSLGIS